MDAKIIAMIRDLSREQCEEILTQYGFVIYDDETNEELREAIDGNYRDGAIDSYAIALAWES